MKAEQIAAFVDRRLTSAERLTVEAHLADCAECRAEVVEAGRLVTGTSRRRFRAAIVGGVAIAAAAVLVVSVSRHAAGSRSDELMRGTDRNALTAIGPHGTVSRKGLTLVWAAAGAGAMYRITLANAAGKPLWVFDGRDTSAVVPDSIALSPGADYYWTADALLAEGSARTTTAQSFRVSP